MAKRPTRLTEVTKEGLEASNATLDRRRQQLDDAREQGAGSTEEQATEGADSGLLDLPGGRERDAGAPGEEAVADAEVADVGGEPAGERSTNLLVEQRGQTPSSIRDLVASQTETGPAAPNGQEAPDLNPIAGVGDAPANPLADVAGSGLRGTSRLTTPEAEGVQAGPSVAVTPGGEFNSRLAFHSAGNLQSTTEDDDGNTVLVFDDQTVTVKENEFTVVSDAATFTVTNNGDSVTEVRDNTESGSLVVSTTTFTDGERSTTTTRTVTNEDGSVTTTTTNPDGSSSSTTTAPVVAPSAEVPADDFEEAPVLAGTIVIGGEVQAPRRGPDDGATDPTEGDEIAFGVPSGPVPDLQDRLLGGDNLEPDFGGGSAPSGPGNVDQTGAITPNEESDFGTGQRGPEQSAFDRVEQTQEQLPEEDEEEDEQSFQRGDINGDGVVDRRDLDPEAFRPTTEVGPRDLPDRIDVDDD